MAPEPEPDCVPDPPTAWADAAEAVLSLAGVALIAAAVVWLACGCARGQVPVPPSNAPVVAVPPSNAPQAAPVFAGYRSPSGHTHTCSKGHTWDHTMDGGSHRCPWCGEAQYVVDPVPRMVPTYAAGPAPRQQPQPYQQPYQQGGCPNGACPAATAPQRSGLILRRW